MLNSYSDHQTSSSSTQEPSGHGRAWTFGLTPQRAQRHTSARRRRAGEGVAARGRRRRARAAPLGPALTCTAVWRPRSTARPRAHASTAHSARSRRGCGEWGEKGRASPSTVPPAMGASARGGERGRRRRRKSSAARAALTRAWESGAPRSPGRACPARPWALVRLAREAYETAASSSMLPPATVRLRSCTSYEQVALAGRPDFGGLWWQ